MITSLIFFCTLNNYMPLGTKWNSSYFVFHNVSCWLTDLIYHPITCRALSWQINWILLYQYDTFLTCDFLVALWNTHWLLLSLVPMFTFTHGSHIKDSTQRRSFLQNVDSVGAKQATMLVIRVSIVLGKSASCVMIEARRR